ncbi:carbohydrate kinase, partial [Rhizobium ruizarguesonis]
NIRPGFIKDKPSHMARIKRMAGKSDIVKFSDEDLDWFGLQGDHDAGHVRRLVLDETGTDVRIERDDEACGFAVEQGLVGFTEGAGDQAD